MGRAPCCDKANVKKGPWSPEEDAKLKAYIEQHGTGGNWIALPQKIGLKRCGKSCRLRWLNYLRPNIKHGGFSEEEDNIICSLYVSIGSRWSIIAAQLPGRTDNDIKNYWNTRLKKKLLGKQRKEQQAQARRVSGLKHQEMMKREPQDLVVMAACSSSSSGGLITQQTPYWPAEHCVPVMPTNASNNIIQGYDHLISNQTSPSLRNLVNELGEIIRFPHDHHQPPSYSTTAINAHDSREISFPQDQVYPTTMINSVAMVSTDANNNNGGTSHHHQPSIIFQGYENFPSDDDLSHLVCVKPQQIEGSMQGFYGMESMDMASGSTNTASTDQSTSWGDMSSLVYSPNLVADYEGGCRHGIPQDAAFEDSRYFGIQMQ